MTDRRDEPDKVADIFTEMLRMQGEAARQVMISFSPKTADSMPRGEDFEALGSAFMELQERVFAMSTKDDGKGGTTATPLFADPSQWMDLMQGWYKQVPGFDPGKQQEMWEEGLSLWQTLLTGYSDKGESEGKTPDLPRKDPRFGDPLWREQPVFALIHQTYLLLAERIREAVDTVEGLDDADRKQLRFATKSMLDAMSPANFPMMNPVVLERTIESKGKNLLRGMEMLSADLEKGQLTHTDTKQFKLGENVAATPGKVIFETELFQLIQYSPVTEDVLAVPLLIFPPWINRFYILDLNPKKSFVKWAVEQGLTVLMVSWKSADESLAHIGPDDYSLAQMLAIDTVRERLNVPAVHTIGYCVGGTTLAMTLAALARRGEADKVVSATFFTSQVDFEESGDLRLFVDESSMQLIRNARKDGYLDGRYLAATFNLLRGGDLIWNYVVNHYMLGEDYPAFDLLYWNGDVTNLPSKWHEAYLRDFYRDNLLVQPDRLEVDGTPIDLTRIETPAYVQAGREDHIAPPKSVFRILSHFSGPVKFVLAGSGHIAGVVNPPAANKYQYWTGPEKPATLEDFVDQAQEHPGSWWPDWLAWVEAHDSRRLKAKGRRRPGGKTNPAIEDAPGRYVMTR